jgi:hypothetical protein
MLILGLACAGVLVAAQARAENPMRKQSVTMYANNVHEECFHLGVGDSVDYRYKSTSTVIFNIHYHTETDVITPLEERTSRPMPAVTWLGRARSCCMMWDNVKIRPACNMNFASTGCG